MTENSHIVMFKNVRLNMFDNQLYDPQAEQTVKGKNSGKMRFNWGAKFIFASKDSAEGKAQVAAAKSAIVAAKVAKWKDKADDVKVKLSNTPIQDGDDEEVTTFGPMKGAYFMSASKTVYGQKGSSESDVPKRPFRIIGPRKVKDPASGELKFPDVKAGDENAPYSGSYVNVKVEFWAQEADSERGIPNRINATILAVQFAKHGESFGGGTRVNVDDEFDEEDGDDLGGGSDDSDDEL
jgi:hypothetical protein